MNKRQREQLEGWKDKLAIVLARLSPRKPIPWEEAKAELGLDRLIEWSVLIEARSASDDRLPLEGDGAADRFMDLVELHHGVASCGGAYWGARIGVDAMDIAGAFEQALGIVQSAAAEAGLPHWPVVRCEVVDRVEQGIDLARPQVR